MIRTTLLAVACVLLAGLGSVPQALAIDSIKVRGAKKSTLGTISKISRDEVTIRSGPRKTEKTIPAGQIIGVNWDGEPAELKLIRAAEDKGRLQAAIDGYERLLKEIPRSSENLRTDLEFLIGRCIAKMALADRSKYDQAVARLESLRTSHPTHFRYYANMLQLGRLYVTGKDFDRAQSAFDSLSKASWPQYQRAGRIAKARILLAQGNVDEAIAAFDEVLAVEENGPTPSVGRLESMLGKAACLLEQKKYEESAEVLQQITKLAPTDAVDVLAEAYLRQGDCLRLSGKTQDALLAYLHVDLLFSAGKRSHPEALFRLVQLWTAVGKPSRATDAKARLSDLYPNNSWTEQLTSGTVN